MDDTRQGRMIEIAIKNSKRSSEIQEVRIRHAWDILRAIDVDPGKSTDWFGVDILDNGLYAGTRIQKVDVPVPPNGQPELLTKDFYEIWVGVSDVDDMNNQNTKVEPTKFANVSCSRDEPELIIWNLPEGVHLTTAEVDVLTTIETYEIERV